MRQGVSLGPASQPNSGVEALVHELTKMSDALCDTVCNRFDIFISVDSDTEEL